MKIYIDKMNIDIDKIPYPYSTSYVLLDTILSDKRGMKKGLLYCGMLLNYLKKSEWTIDEILDRVETFGLMQYKCQTENELRQLAVAIIHDKVCVANWLKKDELLEYFSMLGMITEEQRTIWQTNDIMFVYEYWDKAISTNDHFINNHVSFGSYRVLNGDDTKKLMDYIKEYKRHLTLFVDMKDEGDHYKEACYESKESD